MGVLITPDKAIRLGLRIAALLNNKSFLPVP
jgi:hypothetical protein